jgi:hypothetical protein
MLILWVMVVVLIATLVVLIGLLKGILGAARSIMPTVTAIAVVAAAASKDIDAVIALVTTQNYISQTPPASQTTGLARRCPPRRVRDVMELPVALIILVITLIARGTRPWE